MMIIAMCLVMYDTVYICLGLKVFKQEHIPEYTECSTLSTMLINHALFVDMLPTYSTIWFLPFALECRQTPHSMSNCPRFHCPFP